MVVALGGGAAIGALTATPSSVAAPAPATPAPTTAAPPATARAAGATPAGLRRVRGTVTAISPTSLTLQLRTGRSVTIAVTPATRFGTGRTTTPVAVGDTVVVAGTRSAAGTWTATRVRPAAATPSPTPVPLTTPAAG